MTQATPPDPTRRRRISIALAVVATGLVLLAFPIACATTPGVAADQRAPDLSLTDDQGGTVQLRERLDAGKIVVLSFYPADGTYG